MRGGTRFWALITFVVMFVHVAHVAYADRVGDLAAMLSSSSDKTRIGAVVSLAKLGDKRALKPLVTALHDPNAQVRALAATALGKLGHKAALPALTDLATNDSDENVRARARDAAALVAKANHIASDPAGGDAPSQARAHTSGFGHSPHAVDDKPDLYVLIKGANDDSPGKADKATRKANADILKASITDQLKTAPQVTMTAETAQRWGLDARHIDLSVVRLEVVQNGGYIEMQTELRLAISDDTGKMLSFLSGGAKVQVPKGKFNLNALPMMRRDALEGAMRGMFDKLLAHLRQTSQS